MPETTKPTPMAIPRTFMTEAPAAAMNVGFTLMSRRSNAIAEYWRSFAEVREPTDLMAVQLNYWTQLVDDYQVAFNEGMSQLSRSAESAQAESGSAARSA
jgi:hypothetical protein